MALQEFEFKVEHRAGTKIRHGYRLSCFLIADSNISRLVEVQDNDSWIKAVKYILTNNVTNYYLKVISVQAHSFWAVSCS